MLALLEHRGELDALGEVDEQLVQQRGARGARCARPPRTARGPRRPPPVGRKPRSELAAPTAAARAVHRSFTDRFTDTSQDRRAGRPECRPWRRLSTTRSCTSATWRSGRTRDCASPATSVAGALGARVRPPRRPRTTRRAHRPPRGPLPPRVGVAAAGRGPDVDVYVHKLRSKLEAALPEHRFIHTHVGLRLPVLAGAFTRLSHAGDAGRTHHALHEGAMLRCPTASCPRSRSAALSPSASPPAATSEETAAAAASAARAGVLRRGPLQAERHDPHRRLLDGPAARRGRVRALPGGGPERQDHRRRRRHR